MPAVTSENYDVVVVGAGWSGLICAQTYLKLAPQTKLKIIDAGRTVGGVWSKEKVYPDLYAQIAHPLFEYSSYRMPAEGLSPEGFISGRTIHKYLNDFAHKFGLMERMSLETAVTKTEKTESGGWRLETNNGPTLITDKLIWAVGGTSCAISPKWPNQGNTTPIIHSSQVGENLKQIEKIQSAVVVGAAKSALDTVYMLLKAGKKVHWVIREDGSGPLAMAAPTLFGLWNVIDVISTRSVASFSPQIMNTKGVWFNAINHTAVGRFTTKAIWRVVEAYSSYMAGYSKDENWGKLRPEPHGYGIFWAQAGLGAASAPNFWENMHNGDLTVYRDEVAQLGADDQVTLKGGDQLKVDMIFTCTGFEKPYRTWAEELRQDHGLQYADEDAVKWAKLEAQAEVYVDAKLPILKDFSPEKNGHKEAPADTKAHLHGPSRHYRRLIPPSKGAANDRTVFFPGMIHSIFTPLIVECQALWGAAYLLGHLELPSEAEMNQEVARWNVWTRKRYLAQGRKHSYAMFDFLSYIDNLVSDLGINTARKSNSFKEMFYRYKPMDYEGMIEEFVEVQRKKGNTITL